jgi:uncharacterized protein (UPF0147 family)
MSDITQILEERAVSYDEGGPSSAHTAQLLRQAKGEIEALRHRRDEFVVAANIRMVDQNAEIERLTALLDPPVCRLQFPDGTVPGNVREAAEGWKRWADDFQQRLMIQRRSRVGANGG